MTPLYEKVLETHVIIILSSARIAIYNGNTYILILKDLVFVILATYFDIMLLIL